MAKRETHQNIGGLPKGYAAAPIHAADVPVRLCVVVHVEAARVEESLVRLRSGLDSRVYLGCVCDAVGRVVRWVELWVQSLDLVAASPESARQVLSNAALDKRWLDHVSACEAAERATGGLGLICTGYEREHPAPLVIDLERLIGVHPIDTQTGEAWALCRDEKVLAVLGAPGYGGTTHRYLYLSKLGEASPLVAVTPGSPTIGTGPTLASVIGKGRAELNVGGGLMMVRAWHPMGFEEFIDALGSEPSSAVVRLAPALVESGLGGDGAVVRPFMDGSMFLARHGRGGRLVESFHVRLRLLSDAVSSVREVVRVTGVPLLNVSASSFRVRMDEPGGGLPVVWSSRASLVEGSDAVALAIPGTDTKVFLRGAERGVTIYTPESAGRSVRSRGSVRIRQIESGRSGVIVTGTLTTQERLSPGPTDLAWLRMELPGVTADLYGVLESAAALATGEWRFRSLQQRLPEGAVTALKDYEGVPIHDVSFETLPQMSSPCDLYSLAVLAVRTLLVNPGNTLAVALDEMLSLARQCAVAAKGGGSSLEDRIGSLLDQDRRWIESLGPHRLTREEMSPQAGLDLIPREVWVRTLAMIVRMFPGMGPDSVCRDLGDANPSGPHGVFDAVLEDLSRLLVETRSLIVIDWRFNREIHSVVRDIRMGLKA